MASKLYQKISLLYNSDNIRNSFWGIASFTLQTFFISLFFIVLARNYSKDEFASFLVANSIYQFMAAISNLGLGQWFTREIVGSKDTARIIHKFLRLQLLSGALFYFLNLFLAFAFYGNREIRMLAILLGTNIIFDNLIYAIKCLNTAQYNQNLSFKILIADSILKFLVVSLIFIFPLSIITLSVSLIIVRFLTLNFFLQFGTSRQINLKALWRYKLGYPEVKSIVIENWSFLVLGSISVIYWRIGSIIVSKTMAMIQIANYEISFRIFSVAQIFPLVISLSLYPSFVKLYNEDRKVEFRAFYERIFMLFFVYGVFVFTFIYSFSEQLIPFLFGSIYREAGLYTKEMFLTVLVFPTSIFQAVLLTSMRLEKMDMKINIISLAVYILLSMIGLIFYKSLTTINLAIFVSFLVFHICQDAILIKRGVLKSRNMIWFYLFSILIILTYVVISSIYTGIYFFFYFWSLALVCFILFRWKKGRRSFLHNTE